MVNFLPTTTEVLKSAERFDSADLFLSAFTPAFDAVRSTVFKLETRQEYEEKGNKSLELYLSGQKEKSLALLQKNQNEDADLYRELAERGVDFIRCRPITIPKTRYVEWEILNYQLLEKLGERIFFCHYKQLNEVFEQNALHDFMVFDARFALIHDYDRQGRLVGGWRVDDLENIVKLITLFSFVRVNCFDYKLTL